jgi:hypothetical protein
MSLLQGVRYAYPNRSPPNALIPLLEPSALNSPSLLLKILPIFNRWKKATWVHLFSLTNLIHTHACLLIFSSAELLLYMSVSDPLFIYYPQIFFNSVNSSLPHPRLLCLWTLEERSPCRENDFILSTLTAISLYILSIQLAISEDNAHPSNTLWIVLLKQAVNQWINKRVLVCLYSLPMYWSSDVLMH